jgi:RNA-binding protein YhbY
VEERARVLGETLTEDEVTELIERYRHSDCTRQINLGKGGVTHNMIDDIHNHWKKAEAVRIKCLGVPTLDMDNICFHLEVSIIRSPEHGSVFLSVDLTIVVFLIGKIRWKDCIQKHKHSSFVPGKEL